MIAPEVLAQIETILQDVSEHGFGEVRIVIQNGVVVHAEPRYSYQFNQKNLTIIDL